MKPTPKPRSNRQKHSAQKAATPIHEVLIVGAGFVGLRTALRLQQEGIRDVVILDRAQDIGGTWRDNTYPGAACDIPSNLYSSSFAPNPDWSRSFSGSREILDYVHHLADANNLRRLVRLNQEVTGLVFDEEGGVWTATTACGDEFRARSVVMAQGPLSNASFPAIDGLDSFQGKTMHSASWDHSYDISGKRVAVIGTGASAVQVVPELVKQASRVKVFQRTPGWVLPKPDFSTPSWNRTVFRKLPASQSLVRKATQQNAAKAPGPHQLEFRLQELAPHRGRLQRHHVPGVCHPVCPPDGIFRARGLPGAGAMSARQVGWRACHIISWPKSFRHKGFENRKPWA
ncbi:flavin-containing monooxygenase [Marinobacter salicampi]|uniref:flavin-containing monooxygenase n=1 Tax=Marinobacter salicampi TaxID=435907 RepID=UPI001F5E3EE8|nr:NAD(P)/FAD-dependent oxidoreductase [Marinobacter salicampi]